MKKVHFWRADWFVGLLVVLLFLFSANSDLMQSMERKAYDLCVLASSHTPRLVMCSRPLRSSLRTRS